MKNILNKITKWGIYIMVFLLPVFFLPLSTDIFEFNKQYLLLFGSSFLFLVWMFRMIVIEKEIKLKWFFINIPILLFLLVSIFSTIFSTDKVSSILGFYGRFSGSLVEIISLVIFYFLVINNVRSLKAENREAINGAENKEEAWKGATVEGSLNSFLWSSCVVILINIFSVFGIWQLLASLLSKINYNFPLGIFNRIFNPLSGSPAALAIFLAIVLVLCVALFFQKNNTKVRTCLISFLMFFSTLLLVMIDFTSAWIVLGTTSLLFFIFSLWLKIYSKKVDWLLIPFVLFIISVLGIVFQVSGIIKLQVLGFDVFNQPQEILLDQKTTFSTAINTIKNYPLLGSGLGTFPQDFTKLKPKDFNQNTFWQLRFDRSSNNAAEVLMTTGILGILAWLGIIISFLLIIFFSIGKIKKEENDFLPVLIFVFIALLITQFVYYQNVVLAFLFWLVLGLFAAFWPNIREIKFSFKQKPEVTLFFDLLMLLALLVSLGVWFFGIKFYLADVQYREGASTQNTAILERAVALNQLRANYKITLSRSYFSDALNEINNNKDTQKAQTLLFNSIEEAKKVESVSPNWVVGPENLGMLYRDLRGYVKDVSSLAIDYFNKALEMEPNNPVLLVEIGKIYVGDEKNEEAKKEFEKALELKSNYAEAEIQLALLLEAGNDLDGAITKLKDIVGKYPLNMDGHFQLGRIYYNKSQIEDAISELEKAAYISPNNSNSLYALGLAYRNNGDTDKAKIVFQRVLMLNPDNQAVKSMLSELEKPLPPEETENK